MSDRSDLADFVVGVRDILQQVVEWRGLLFREELREPIAEAWQELRPSFDDVMRALVEGDEEERVSDEELRRVGLTGRQLQLKLIGFNGAWDRLRQWGSVKVLKKVLEWIDIILGSLASIIPGADAIEEFKDSAKAGIDENE
jgi:hypothetical protein